MDVSRHILVLDSSILAKSNMGRREYKILEHCPKRKTRDQELKSKKGALLELDDSEDENGGRNKDKPEGNKKAKERIGLRLKPQIWARRLRRW
jgi:hypothetical protein